MCKKWHQLSSTADLWKAHCQLLGWREGVGDLASAVEVAASSSSVLATVSSGTLSGVRGELSKDALQESESFVDWKRAYRDLSQVMVKIKAMVIKTGIYLL